MADTATAATQEYQRGIALRSSGRHDDAVSAFRRVLELQPESAAAHLALGNALKAAGKIPEAASALGYAVQLAPTDPVGWLNLGVVKLELRRAREAADCFRRAIALEPNRPEAHNILGVALLQEGQVAAAQTAFRAALQLRPAYAAAHDNLGCTYRAQARIADAMREFEAALALQRNPETHSNLLYVSNFAASLAPEEIFAAHRRWSEWHERPHANERQTYQVDFDPARRLRVGFVSADFINHAVAYFFAPLLIERDPSAIEIVCYSGVKTPDATTSWFRSLADEWRDIAGMSNAAVAETVRRDRVDILIDLSGHTADNRLLVFVRKPAPLAVTWLGYPNTTGLDAIDYRITDGIADPDGAEALHSEKLQRLPGPFLCYRPPANSPVVSALPALRTGRVTFGSFSNFAKVSEPCLAVWLEVLKAVPRSRLILKSRGLDDGETLTQVRARIAAGGVDPVRVEFDARVLSVADHLALYGDIDIALDPFPYNGTTTTCEALSMGVPVITLTGRMHVQRVGTSLLTHLGCPEWIASTRDECVDRCVALAADLPVLAKVRAGLRAKFLTSPLCDAPAFARRFEAALREMWTERCRAG